MLKIEHLTKHYKGSKKGITDLSLHIAPGDLYAFIGHNGAGKTTTLKCVTGIQDFDAGSVQICGVDLTKDPVLCKQQFAYIPDNPDIYEYLTGIQYLNFTADVFKIGAAKRAERIRTYGDLFEITASLGDLISSYSHGMKQKLALLAALVHEPGLLICGAASAVRILKQDQCRGDRAGICGGYYIYGAQLIDFPLRGRISGGRNYVPGRYKRLKVKI